MKNLLIYIIVITIIYFFRARNLKEGFNNSALTANIRKIINKEYDINLESMRNLSLIATSLQENGLTIPGDFNVKGKINFLPSGCIIAYNKETAPDGWALCDGENGTPDLRGRFIKMATLDLDFNLGSGSIHETDVLDQLDKNKDLIGASRSDKKTYIYKSTINDKGGSDFHALTKVEEQANHKHNVETDTGGGHRHTINLEPFMDHNHSATYEGSHKHPFIEESVGNSIAHPSLPSYYVLVYIMRL